MPHCCCSKFYMLRAYFYFFNCQIKFLCPLLYLIFFKKNSTTGREEALLTDAFILVLFFYFPLCLFLLHLQYKKKLNHRMHTPPRRFPGAPTAPDRPGAPARQPPSRPVRCSDHQLRGKNVLLQLRLPSLHPIPSKRVCG